MGTGNNFEPITGCYRSEDSKILSSYALYDADEDYLCYITDDDKFKHVEGFYARFGSNAGWKPIANCEEIPHVSRCAECNTPLHIYDYLCASCRMEIQMELTPQEQEAIAHVEERVRVDGTHSLNSCPYPCRAMCSYRKVLTELARKGYKFEESNADRMS